jgi:hypothetical protein
MLFDNLAREKMYKREGYLCFFCPAYRSSPVQPFIYLTLYQEAVRGFLRNIENFIYFLVRRRIKAELNSYFVTQVGGWGGGGPPFDVLESERSLALPSPGTVQAEGAPALFCQRRKPLSGCFLPVNHRRTSEHIIPPTWLKGIERII